MMQTNLLTFIWNIVDLILYLRYVRPPLSPFLSLTTTTTMSRSIYIGGIDPSPPMKSLI